MTLSTFMRSDRQVKTVFPDGAPRPGDALFFTSDDDIWFSCFQVQNRHTKDPYLARATLPCNVMLLVIGLELLPPYISWGEANLDKVATGFTHTIFIYVPDYETPDVHRGTVKRPCEFVEVTV